jgi:hypothetical protein
MKFSTTFPVIMFVVILIGFMVWSLSWDSVHIKVMNINVENQTVDCRARVSINGNYEKDFIIEDIKEGEVDAAKIKLKKIGKEYIKEYNELKRIK